MIYPRGLSMKDYPLVLDPVYAPGRCHYKKISGDDMNFVDITKGTAVGELGAIDIHLDDIDLAGYDEIIYACDPDHSGAVCFHLIIEHY